MYICICIYTYIHIHIYMKICIHMYRSSARGLGFRVWGCTVKGSGTSGFEQSTYETPSLKLRL